MAVNDTYFFTVQGTLGGRNYVHTLHFREVLAPPAINPAQSLIDRWQAAAQSAWIAAHPTAYTITRLTAQRICGTLPLPSRVEEGVGVAGNRATGTTGELLPPWLAVAVNMSTGLAGKSRHGRFFMSGGGESDVSGETLVSGVAQWLNYITGYVNALTTAFVAGPPADWRLVVHSRKLADIAGTQCTESSEPVTALGIVSRLTSQRSRRA